MEVEWLWRKIKNKKRSFISTTPCKGPTVKFDYQNFIKEGRKFRVMEETTENVANSDLVEELRRQLAQLALRLAEKDEQLAEKDEKLAEKDEQLGENYEQLGVGLLLRKGLPPLGTHGCSNNQTPNYGKHEPYNKPVQATDGEFAVLDEYKLDTLPLNLQSKIWKRVKDGNLGVWNHESHIQSFVSDVIVDVIELAGLSGQIHAYLEAQLNITEHLRADIVIFRKHGVIIGVCEVKKPSIYVNDLENDMLRIQISNYMLHLKHSHGLRAVFGIVSTYNKWKLCWLADAKTIAESNEETSVLFLPSEESEFEILYESRTFARDDPHLIEALVSVIRKMVNSPIDPPTQLIRHSINQRKFGFVNRESFKWSLLPLTLTHFNFDTSRSDTSNFYLLEDFHGGADGRVWLCATQKGKLGVMKLSATSEFTHEKEVWTDVWQVSSVRTLQILGCNALLMPYAFHGGFVEGKLKFRPFGFWNRDNFELEDYNNLEVSAVFDLDCIAVYTTDPLKAAEEALQKLVDHGYVHRDVHWRHVALLPEPPKDVAGKWTVTPIMIDCSTAVRSTSEDELRNFVPNALNDLLAEIDMMRPIP
jgi:hypothetical protein